MGKVQADTACAAGRHYQKPILESFDLAFGRVVFAGAGIGLSWLFMAVSLTSLLDILDAVCTPASVSACFWVRCTFLFYLIGEERGEIILGIALLCAFVMDWGLISILNGLIPGPGGLRNINRDSGAVCVLSSSAFFLSCPLTPHGFAAVQERNINPKIKQMAGLRKGKCLVLYFVLGFFSLAV